MFYLNVNFYVKIKYILSVLKYESTNFLQTDGAVIQLAPVGFRENLD